MNALHSRGAFVTADEPILYIGISLLAEVHSSHQGSVWRYAVL